MSLASILLTGILSVSPANHVVAKCPQWEPMLRKHGLPVKHFSFIMWRESRCNPLAVSSKNNDGSTDYGLLQINSTWRTLTARTCARPARQVKKSLLKFECNLKVAKVLFDTDGLGHWAVN
jgi:soluble lytic murein transglycosylase-like protein